MIRRLIYLLILILWAVIMCFPVLAFTVAIRGHVEFGNTLRIFLVQEDSQGLGIQWNRSDTDQEECIRSSVRYFFWDGDERSQNVDFCRCYDNGEINSLVTGDCLTQ